MTGARRRRARFEGVARRAGVTPVPTVADLSLATYLRPPSTVRVPLGELGPAAVDAVLHELGSGRPRHVVGETRPEAAVRGSTGSPG